MKIAISGSHATGKTTLANFISEKYNIPLLSEKARYHMENGYPFDLLEKDLDLFIEFQNKVLDSQIEEEKKYSCFVTDRTLLDSYVYLKERLIKERYHDYSILEKYYNKVITNQSSYDRIFFIKVNNNLLKNDGFRNINEYYVKAIEEMLEYEYNKIRLNPIAIVNSSFEKRKEIVYLNI